MLCVCLYMSVWEVRHGSVMALREILTHQGASVGILMPDLGGDGVLLSELKDNGTRSTFKREKEIDLNMQVAADECVSAPKRLKLEDSSSQLLDVMNSSIINGCSDGSIKVEASGMNLGSQQANGELSASTVKVEYEPGVESSGCLSEDLDGVRGKSFSEDKVSIGKTDLLNVIPENCELTKLVKLARHSWLKHSEFLQDCAVRFLCVLSLDRYGIGVYCSCHHN